MSLIVETGQGLSTAQSYISVADANTRHTSLGNTAWTGADAVKEAALRRATQFMEQYYRTRWKGTRLTRDQALAWPRYGIEADGWYYPSDTIPTEIANACADLALRALSGDLAPDVTRLAIRTKVGSLETEYDPYSPQSPQYRSIDMALAPFLFAGGVMARVARA